MVARVALLGSLWLTGCALAAGLGDFTPASDGGAGGEGGQVTGGAPGGGGAASVGGAGGDDGCAGDLLISEARTNGSAAGYDDFVEIYNPTSSARSLLDISVAARTLGGGVNERWRGGRDDMIEAHGHFLIVGQAFDDGSWDVKLDASGSFPNELLLLLRSGPLEASLPIDVLCLCTDQCDSADYDACAGVVVVNPAFEAGQIEDIDASVQRMPECVDTDEAADFQKGAATPTSSP